MKLCCDFRWLEAMEKAIHPVIQVSSGSVMNQMSLEPNNKNTRCVL